MSHLRRDIVVCMIASALSVAVDRPAAAENEAAVTRGLQYLKPMIGTQKIGESALMGLALIKGDYPKDDPALVACVAKIRTRFQNGVYVPQLTGGPDVYEAGVVAMLLGNYDAETRSTEVGIVAQYLIGAQKANGSWDYTNRANGDTSISQYAVLGLWEAENAGTRVPPAVWDRAAGWFLSVQGPEGSWNYHRDEPNHIETVAMTAAGVGSLLICQRQLAHYRRPRDTQSPLLVPLSPEGAYDPRTTDARIDQAVKGGLAWLASSFNPATPSVMGMSTYYALYGIERVGALADRAVLGRTNWFDQGRRFILATQAADGSWTSQFGTEVNTVWAILFLTRSTAKTIRRIEIKRLGAGTLLGGRGLPKDLSSMTVAGGRVVSRPMNGAVEGMLAVLEDPRAQASDAALSGLVKRYETGGRAVLRPHKDRFRKLLRDRDPGLRQIGAWGLGRVGDLEASPWLINALTDPDEDVVTAARLSLQLLSRKIGGVGPPIPSSPEQRLKAARAWREWYNGIRPLDLEGQDDDAAPGTVSTPAIGSAR